MTTLADGDALMTADELSNMTTVAVGTLGQWRYNGKGPAWFKLHGRVVYKRSAVLTWIAEAEQANRRGP